MAMPIDLLESSAMARGVLNVSTLAVARAHAAMGRARFSTRKGLRAEGA